MDLRLARLGCIFDCLAMEDFDMGEFHYRFPRDHRLPEYDIREGSYEIPQRMGWFEMTGTLYETSSINQEVYSSLITKADKMVTNDTDVMDIIGKIIVFAMGRDYASISEQALQNIYIYHHKDISGALKLGRFGGTGSSRNTSRVGMYGSSGVVVTEFDSDKIPLSYKNVLLAVFCHKTSDIGKVLINRETNKIGVIVYPCSYERQDINRHVIAVQLNNVSPMYGVMNNG